MILIHLSHDTHIVILIGNILVNFEIFRKYFSILDHFQRILLESLLITGRSVLPTPGLRDAQIPGDF